MQDDHNRDVATCTLCEQELTAKERDVCGTAPERFDGKLLCEEHQRRFSACRAVRGLFTT